MNPEPPITPLEDTGFVKRGFLLLGGMTVLVLTVLAIILYRPPQTPPMMPSDLPPESAPGWQIRYNATVALARRGSDQVPWKVVREMLSEKQQFKNFPVLLHDGREVPDEAAARATVVTGLKAVAEWHRKHAGNKPVMTPALQDVYAAVDQLAESPIAELKIQAERTRSVLPH